MLGLGTQIRAHVERRFSMPWSPPVARMREYVAALRAIWSAWQDGTPMVLFVGLVHVVPTALGYSEQSLKRLLVTFVHLGSPFVF